jgi:hypothetical protein
MLFYMTNDKHVELNGCSVCSHMHMYACIHRHKLKKKFSKPSTHSCWDQILKIT